MVYNAVFWLDAFVAPNGVSAQASPLELLTNQFTGAWTHYKGTPQGTQTDHIVGWFQRISIE